MGLISLLGIQSTDTLLDLGCGTGRITMAIADKARTTVGMDFSFASLKVFEKRIPPDWKGRVHLVQGDAFHLPLRSRIFHQVVSNGVFEHLPGLLENKGPVLEAARVLANQGVFVFSIYNYSVLRAFMARVFPVLTYGAGYEQEGFHAGKIYFRRYRWQEIQDLLKEAFEVEHIGGMRIIPKGTLKRGGKIALSLERALQGSTVSRSLGYYLLVSGRKRG
jgi:ubiquinone/menaquinone biosynthesis C-methylase UbiE